MAGGRKPKRSRAAGPADGRRGEGTDLRAHAEEVLAAHALGARGGQPDLPRLVHELEVHQIELQLQNEELRAARAELERAARTYEELYELAPVGYFNLDAAGVIRRVNLAGSYLFGEPRARLAGKRFRPFVGEEARQEFDRFLAKVFRDDDGEKAVCELPLRREGREDVYVRLEASASADGTVCRAVLFDVTERRRQERELARTKADAEHATRAKSEFLAKMSHEVRTPLNGVLGMLELALLEEQTPRAREYLLLGRQAARSLLEIVNDLLDLTKIEARRLELAHAPFDLRAAVEGVVGTLSVVARQKGLALTSEVDPALPATVLGDGARLRQVLMNLVGNGLKFTEAGSVEVSVVLDETGQTGQPSRTRLTGVLFTVRDTGIGIGPEDLETIFESFTQAARPTYGGAGLGLSISRQLVELMGGELWAESLPGEGSVFRFRVGFELPEPELREGSARAGRRPSPARPPRSLSVLVAEDNRVNQVLIEELLLRLGHRVTVAANGRQALEALERECPDLVLMDIEMPVLGGLEATREIREGGVPGCPRKLPVVALTAHAVEGDRERFLAAGMDDYLSKPFDLEELEGVLARVKGGSRREPAGPGPSAS